MSGSADSEIRAWDLVFQEEGNEERHSDDDGVEGESPAKRTKLDEEEDDEDDVCCFQSAFVFETAYPIDEL